MYILVPDGSTKDKSTFAHCAPVRHPDLCKLILLPNLLVLTLNLFFFLFLIIFSWHLSIRPELPPAGFPASSVIESDLL